MDWSSGYVYDVNYTHGYYPGLNPLNLNLSFTGYGHGYQHPIDHSLLILLKTN